MKNLNSDMKELIKFGIKEEAEKDIRIHAAMKHETAEVFERYLNDEGMWKEVAYNALCRICDFWQMYQDYGYEEALAYQERLRAQERAEAERVLKEAEEKRVANLLSQLEMAK